MARHSRIVLVGCVGALVLATCGGESTPVEEVDPPAASEVESTTSSTTTTTTQPPPTTVAPTTTTTTTEPPTTTTTTVVILEPEAAFEDADTRATEIGWFKIDGLIAELDFALDCAEGSGPVQVPEPAYWGGWAPPGARFEQVRVSAYPTEAGAQGAFDLRRGWFESCTADQAVGYARSPIDLGAPGLLGWNVDVLNGEEVLGSNSVALALEGVTVWVVSAADEPTLRGALEGMGLVP